jgi:hypothetical protein
MRTSVIVFALAAAVAAFPRADPQFEATPAPALPIVSASAAPNATTTRKHKHHKEPTPTFGLDVCECIKPIIPVNQLSPSEVSDLHSNFMKTDKKDGNGGYNEKACS